MNLTTQLRGSIPHLKYRATIKYTENGYQDTVIIL